ncbi:L-threonylcarbamoyladenylate synthase [Actinomyces dentalis]|uniref:L-threonylcarbamoyladenylate synthase n=1 Tax=Actinomyces dentalis TaxID=272548 RepID=UPI00047B99E0|nr:L-threonylcarbamoyladenylate synthase [Actinomyces dentalis]
MAAVSPHPSVPLSAPAPARALERAAAHVRAGGLLILPTDTVYGIGALASDAAGVSRLLAAKGRDRRMPPPVLVADPAQAFDVVARLPDAARVLIGAFWPGALTLVLDARADLDWDLGESGGTVALRMPDHPLALELLRRTGPMAVTSANRTGLAPATDAAAALAAFPGRVALADDDAAGPHGADILLLDGGPTPGPVPSTIVSLAGGSPGPVVVREGVVPRAELAAVVGPSAAHGGAKEGAGA